MEQQQCAPEALSAGKGQHAAPLQLGQDMQMGVGQPGSCGAYMMFQLFVPVRQV